AVAECRFGGIVLAYDMTPADSGVAPLVVAPALQVVLLGVAAVVVVRRGGGDTGGGAGASVRRDGAGRPGGPGRLSAPAAVGRVPLLAAGRAHWSGRLVATVVACGFFDALANVFVQAGLHSSDDPLTLPVMSVLNALYPIGTVVLAGVVLRERLTPLQLVGIVLAFGASVGLALV
ncbi:EamA family transporter, partial [Curtobacterium sp. B8]|uniref:EamA family transporter n=1 Tax=Curtobacterium sp. B8 TaxID=95611 RepID=UPI0003B65F7A